MTAWMLEAWRDSVEMLPFLLGVYFLIEWVEARWAGRLQHMLQHSTWEGAAAGALLGCVPQCGFSVMASVLYARGAISTGTLLAVFLSTSDEAVPVILARPDRAGWIVPLVLVKVGVAVAAGVLADRVTGRGRRVSSPDAPMEPETCCCHHSVGAQTVRKGQWLLHPLVHTGKVFAYIWGVTVLFNALSGLLGPARLQALLAGHRLLQLPVMCLIGLVPNCAASVVVAQLWLKGVVGFGAAVAGLCCASGLGLLVLARENRNARDTARVVAWMVGASLAAGLLIQGLWS